MRNGLQFVKTVFTSVVVLAALFCARSGNAATANITWVTPATTGTSLSVITPVTGGNAAGVGVDPIGNVYALDNTNGKLLEVQGGNGSASTLLSGLATGTQVTVDASRNVYVANGLSNTVQEYVYTNGAPNYAAPVSIGTGLGTVTGVAVDLSGNVYIVDATNKQVVKVTSGGVQSSFATGFTAPNQIAVDRLGNVYVADSGAGTVVFIPVTATLPVVASSATTIASSMGLSAPQGVATDPWNNVYIADTGNNRIVQALYSATGAGTASVYLASVAAPVSLAIDTRDTLYIAGTAGVSRYTVSGKWYGTSAAANTGNNFTTGIYLGLLPVGTTSQAFTVNVTFNSAVATISAMKVVTEGYTGYDYADLGTGTCNALTSATSGQTCTVNLTFTPLAPGARRGAIVFYGAASTTNTSANVVAGTIYVGGGGLGAVLTTDVPVQQGVTTSSALNYSRGTFSDVAGNVFFSNYQASLDASSATIAAGATISVYSAASIAAGIANATLVKPTTIIPAMTGGKTQGDMNLDGAGNLVTADYSAYLYRIPYEYVAGTNANVWNMADVTTGTSAIGGITTPKASRVDVAGNVYSCSGAALNVYPFGPTATNAGSSMTTYEGTTLAGCASVAVDLYGNLAANNDTAGAINYYPATGAAATVTGASSFSTGMWGIAFDAQGSIWTTASNAHQMERLPVENGVPNYAHVFVETPSSSPEYYGIWVEPNGNIIGGGESSGARGFTIINRQLVSLAPASTLVGGTSAAVTATIENEGNLPATFTGTGLSFSDSVDFIHGGTETTTASIPNTCTSSFASSLQPGFGCILALEATPQSVGALTSTVQPSYNAATFSTSTYPNAFPNSFTPIITLTSTGQTAQTITFSPAASENPYGSGTTFNVTATTTSGLIVNFTSATTSVCTVGTSTLASGTSTATVTEVAVGTCSLTAAAPAGTNNSIAYAAATSVSANIGIGLTAQTISWTPSPTTYPLSTGTFALSATATSGLPVSFASTTSSVCTVSGTTATILTAGTCTIQATQVGDGTIWAIATPVTVNFTITLTPQTITYAPSTTTYPYSSGGTIPLTATADSSLTVSFASTTSSVCTVSGTTATMVAPGTCTIQATQAGDATYAAATPVSVNYTISQDAQTITYAPSVTSYTYLSTTTFALSATSTSGLTVSFASTTPSVCTVSGTTATLVAPGTCTIQATQTGNTDYAAATLVSVNYTISPAVQTITYAPSVTSYTYLTTTTFALSATSTSGLTVSFASTTPSVCTVSGTTATLVAPGTCTIQATQAGNSSYAAATLVSVNYTISQAAQTITYAPSVTTYTYLSGGTFPLSATTTATGLTVSFASTTPSICTVSGTTATMVASGTCTIQATQTGNSSYTAATPVSVNYAIGLTGQTITYAPSVTTYTYSSGGTFPLSATTTATGLTVSFASATPSVCTVSGTTATLVAPGTCTIQATQAGNSSYAAATPVSVNYTILATQTIAYSPSVTTYPLTTGTFSLSATATSSLTVSFASTTPSVCTVSGTTATLVVAGTCTIQATQAGNSSYAAATAVSVNYTITSTQTITYAPSVTTYTYSSGGTFPLSATTTATGLTVSFASTTPSACTVSGTTATLVAPGTCTIQATQAGNSTYSAATPVSVNYTILATQTITYSPSVTSYNYIASGMGTFPLSATTTATGLTVSFASTTPSVCTVSGTTATMLTLGTCTIQATQAGNSTYAAATPVSVNYTINPALQTITYSPSTTTYTYSSGGTIPLSATASSGLTVSFASTTSSICTVSGTTATMVAPGTCTIQATQAGNSTYAAATPVSVNYTINLSTQTITYSPSTTTYAYTSGGTIPLSATASSGLTVSFASTTSSVCTVSGTTATILIAGTCTIQATQTGNGTYAAATAVSVNYTISKAAQTITYAPSVTAYPYLSGGTIALSATATSGLTVSFASTTPSVCSVTATTATILTAGTCTLQATQTGNSSYAAATAVSVNYTIAQNTPILVVSSSLNPTLLNNPITISASVTSTIGVPTGTVNFLNGTTLLGSGTISGGVATFTTSALPLGTTVITVNYLGDTNYLAASDSSLNQAVYTISLGTPTSGNNSLGSGIVQTVAPGGTASYLLPITPSSGTTFPTTLTLTLLGMPTGATATITPSSWVASATLANTWTLPANTALGGNTQLNIQVPQTTAATKPATGLGRNMTPFALALLLLPFASKMRRAGKRFGRILSMFLLLAAGMATMAGLSGCGSTNSTSNQGQSSYYIRAIVSSGTLSQSTTVVLNVE